MACFEQHGQHLAPQFSGLNALEQLQLAGAGLFFVGFVSLFEGPAIQIVQVLGIRWREQCPIAILGHTLHEQVRNPVCGVHVVGTTTIIAGVFTQL